MSDALLQEMAFQPAVMLHYSLVEQGSKASAELWGGQRAKRDGPRGGSFWAGP